MGWFKHWFGTRYYSLLYGHRDMEDARTWVDAILQRWSLPRDAEVLDLACGRGRHSRFFALQGLRVTGVDISQGSIEEARVAVPTAAFHVHDMRRPMAHSAFDAVCCLFTSLGYFDDLEDDRSVFRAVASALRPGGCFVLDFMNTDLVLRELVTDEILERDGVIFQISRFLENGILVKQIRVTDGQETHLFEERVQALRPDELVQMALDAGFLIEDTTDGPVMTPFEPRTSQRFVLWMRKPHT